MSLLNLITEDINDEYCYIKYADFNIIMCKKDQYLNMTKVVSLDSTKEGNPKELKRWFITINANEIIEAVEEEVGLNSVPAYYKIETGTNDLRGTYCHKLLVPHILAWCSAKFAIKISKIVNMYYEHMGDIKMAEANRKHEEILTAMRIERDEARIRHEETKAILISTRDNLDELRTEHESTSFKLDKLSTNMTNLSVKDLKSEQYSLAPIKPNKREALIVTGVRYSRPDSGRIGMFYIVNRIQLCNFKRSRKLMLRRIFSQEPYSSLTKILSEPTDSDSYLLPIFYTTTPNPVNLWTTFRVKHETHFRVENGIIKFMTTEYRINNLIDDLYAYAGIEPLPIEKLTEEYKNALNTEDDD